MKISEAKVGAWGWRRAGHGGMALLLVLALCGMSWQVAEPGYRWSFPRDHWAHPEYASEWWYFTGHLQDVNDPGRTFGYQFTIFRVGLVPPEEGPDSGDSRWRTRQLLMGHAAIGDLQAGEHHFSDLLYRDIPLLAGFGKPGDPVIAWSLGPAGTQERWWLRWNGEAFSMEMHDDQRGMSLALETRPLRPLTYQGPGGLSRKSGDGVGASLYYSFTRLQTHGKITLGGTTWEV